jgi:hypothetical protein
VRREETTTQLMARLEALEHENGTLRQRLTKLEGRRPTAGKQKATRVETNTRTIDRRGLLKALGLTAGAGAAALVVKPEVAAAANGSSVILGANNATEFTTELSYDGSGPPTNGSVLAVTDGAAYIVADSALVGCTVAGLLHNGVYGYTSTAGGNGVVGYGTGLSTGVYGGSDSGTAGSFFSGATGDTSTALSATLNSTTSGAIAAAVFGNNSGTNGQGFGVWGTHSGGGDGVHGSTISGAGTSGRSVSGVGVSGYSPGGIGVAGTADSTAANAVAVSGTITSTTPGTNSAAVYGQNNGMNDQGFGVWGTHGSGGDGVHGSAVTGTGVRGYSSSGTGVSGTTDSTAANAVAVRGTINSTTPGSGAVGVQGQNSGTNANGYGVYGSHAGTGTGGYFTSAGGIGVNASGGSGTGVSASGATGVSATGTATGIAGTVTAAGGNGVLGIDTGTTATGNGIFGKSTNGTAVYGQSAAATLGSRAIYGVLTSSTSGVNAVAVQGLNAGTNATGYGVYGQSNGGGVGAGGFAATGTGMAGTSVSNVGVRGAATGAASGTGVLATSASTAASATALQAILSTTTAGLSAAAVRGQNNDTTGHGIGVYGSQNGSGQGVFGFTPSGIGVQGTSTSGTGVNATSTSGIGVSGTSASTAANAMAVQGVISSTSPGSASAAVRAQNNGTGANGYGVYGTAASGLGVVGSTAAVSGNWAVFGFGNTGATGTKAALVPAENGTHRTLYCLESPECWFEDFGSGTVINGSATVSIDPLFAATVDSTQYHIFLAPEGESKGLYVSAKSASGFTVREQQGGASTVAFSYRLVARRKDVAAPRLATVTLPTLPAPLSTNQVHMAPAAIEPPVPPMLATPPDPSIPQA